MMFRDDAGLLSAEVHMDIRGRVITFDVCCIDSLAYDNVIPQLTMLSSTTTALFDCEHTMQKEAIIKCLHLEDTDDRRFNNAMLRVYQQNNGHEGHRYLEGNPVGNDLFRFVVCYVYAPDMLKIKKKGWTFVRGDDKEDLQPNITFDRLVLMDLKVRQVRCVA